MYKLSLLLFSVLFTLNITAQNKIDRSNQPKPGPAPVITINDPVIIKMPNGITVLVVENHKLPKINASLSIDRGPIVEGDKAGVNQLMGQMLSEGTTKTSKDKFDEMIDQMGTNLSLFASGGGISSLSRYFDKSFLMLAEAIRYPSFPEASFEKIKSQTITSLKSNEKSASAISARVVGALSYGKNTAMGEFQTEESIKGIKLEDVKKAYKENITPSRAYLTFVGDITPQAAESIATKAFGDWKGTKLLEPSIADVQNPSTTEIDFVDISTAVQGEINVSNLINNKLSNPDYHALVIANQILGGGAESKLFMNLREKHGFTYGSYSRVGNGRFQTQFSSTAQVRSEKADSAIAEIINEISNMRNGKITEEELNNAKAKYNGSFALAMEDPEKTASYATNILINNLSKDYYRTFLQKINAVTIADVQRVSNKYFNKDNARIVVVGNGAKILPNLSRLGYPVKKFDKNANPVVEKAIETSTKETPKNDDAVSAQSIIESYLKSIGGKDELRKINSIKSTFTMDAMGTSLQGTEMKMNPNKHSFEVKMGDMKVMESKFDGVKGFQSQMNQKKEMEDDEIKDAQDDKAVIPQLFYVSEGYQVVYTGTEKIGEEDAYKIKVTKPSGKVSVEYYSQKTNLLLREEKTEEAGGNEMTITMDFSNYKKVGGVMFPYTLVQSVSGQEFTLNVNEIKVNEGVTEEDFK
jgi:predicted Zn-dependent peptidase